MGFMIFNGRLGAGEGVVAGGWWRFLSGGLVCFCGKGAFSARW